MQPGSIFNRSACYRLSLTVYAALFPLAEWHDIWRASSRFVPRIDGPTDTVIILQYGRVMRIPSIKEYAARGTASHAMVFKQASRLQITQETIGIG